MRGAIGASGYPESRQRGSRRVGEQDIVARVA